MSLAKTQICVRCALASTSVLLQANARHCQQKQALTAEASGQSPNKAILPTPGCFDASKPDSQSVSHLANQTA